MPQSISTIEYVYHAVVCGFVFMCGGAVGSFVNVLVYRVPRGEDFIFARSRCTKCGTQIKSYDLIPIFSWFILGGKCRKCKEHVSIRYPMIELLVASSYLIAYLLFGLGLSFFISLVLFPVLTVLSGIDFAMLEIPYSCSIAILILGLVELVFSVFSPQRSVWYEHIIGLFIISVPFAVFSYLGAMGGGDVQLVAAGGLLLGWSIVPAILIAFIVGSFFAVFVKITKKSGTICFGPFLALGIAVSYLFGHEIIQFYLQFLK